MNRGQRSIRAAKLSSRQTVSNATPEYFLCDYISLISPSDSLFSQNQSLISIKTYPVTFSREFVKKGQRRWELSIWKNGKNGPESVKFPVFSLLIREFDAESG